MLEAWNKVDLLDEEARETVANEAARRADVVMISAVSGEGIQVLSDRAAAILTSARKPHDVRIAANDGAALAWLHAHGNVERESGEGDMRTITVRLTSEDLARFEAR
jgi:GTP-binding protein HflX